jgi:hypothetical protein
VAENTAPRILAIAEDQTGLVSACRVHAPLFALRRLGLVADYRIADRSLIGVPPDYRFDVVWLQRAVDRRVVERVLEVVGGDFLLDIDDLLIARPAYIDPRHLPSQAHVIEAVKRCRVLTTTSPRLGQLLEERVGMPLTDKMVVCPNALEFPAGWVRPPERPHGIVLTQGHRLALTVSREEVFAAVRDFAARNRLPVYYFGPPRHRLGDGAPRLIGDVVSCGLLDFWRYHAVLAAWPTMIGIAPLETRGDKETLDFVAGKSDIKMVEFGGFGHPGVYSAAPPYVDTDIRSGTVTANTYEGWTEALRVVFKGDDRVGAGQPAVMAARSLDRVAKESWRAAIEAARQPQPITVKGLQGNVARYAGRLLENAARAKQTLRTHGTTLAERHRR